jgi:hypothetical protein
MCLFRNHPFQHTIHNHKTCGQASRPSPSRLERRQQTLNVATGMFLRYVVSSSSRVVLCTNSTKVTFVSEMFSSSIHSSPLQGGASMKHHPPLDKTGRRIHADWEGQSRYMFCSFTAVTYKRWHNSTSAWLLRHLLLFMPQTNNSWYPRQLLRHVLTIRCCSPAQLLMCKE